MAILKIEQRGLYVKYFLILLVLSGVFCSGAARSADAPPAVTHDRKEMVAFVKKAVEFIKKNGKEVAFKKFSNKSETDFHDGDLYLYVNGTNIRVRAGGQPA
jgi:hypothetical protein